jgi:putative peptide zinc metalloprotease protein
MDKTKAQTVEQLTGVPECPTLAPNVRLIGEMKGTGFEDTQWLVERAGRFIQVSELVYRIAEHANGQRTLGEIASQVTEATDWIVEAGDVRQLIQDKLMPVGLISGADASISSQPNGAVRSPLQVNMRVRLLSPSIFEPIAGVLQVLYAPPILIPALIAGGIALGWLYFVHGTVRAFDAFLYTPWLILVLLPTALVSGTFHEFGHAAALQYGGGKVRGMGMGFYLMYPSFYTDVTDCYRLGRWSRVRTALGGVYFDLIFVVGIIALYLALEQEFLLVIAVMTSWHMLYQFLPHVRLDGYWAFADLAGIPDLFSQIGPFLRSILPAAGSQGDKLPRLKRWVAAALVAYIVLAIPAVAALLLLIVAFIPGRLLTAWDAFLNQVREFSTAQSRGDPLGMATAISQAVVLMVLLAGLAYLLFSLTRSWIRAVWTSSKRTPLSRIVGVLGTAALAAFLGWIWTPQVPYTVWGWTVPAGPPGTETFDVPERSHVQTPVVYAEAPPVGGNHAPVWQNCGFYDTAVVNESAVHSMEHGAVWITYQAELPVTQIDALRLLARGQSHVLVSPSDDVAAPIVASAWGRQLRLNSADDPRLDQFVRDFRHGRQAPEPGGPCTGGIGKPQ